MGSPPQAASFTSPRAGHLPFLEQPHAVLHLSCLAGLAGVCRAQERVRESEGSEGLLAGAPLISSWPTGSGRH